MCASKWLQGRAREHAARLFQPSSGGDCKDRRVLEVDSLPRGGDLTFTYTMTVTKTSSSTTTQLQEWSAGIKRSFSFLGVEITGGYKESVTESITETVTSTETKTFTTTCKARADGRPVALWQWVVAAREATDAQSDMVETWLYQAATPNTMCGPADPPPRCPLNKCTDADCQKCLNY
uniref:Uncharacterized protein n=1 Tax=Chromera velia CCMP2878 TaxID=1169474 RepID=A0A0G4HSB5_9ALVE|eukprot:Cvel_31011.t1-p1 / transcript=Cvel_31011.t1 / gene=Cvel_31011 / organism=Chromera_velia_CCMP2878 / gene_product=hypothetical protein / transcript_product=hypothetical protein / location=Cvel_scaffold4538:6896-7426(-) / protein_length=177 / sequence_SO=supercontig / SO=protein_coding / is_pseudo=false